MLFKQDGVNLIYEEEALHETARLAIEKKTGARGLRVSNSTLFPCGCFLLSDTGTETVQPSINFKRLSGTYLN